MSYPQGMDPRNNLHPVNMTYPTMPYPTHLDELTNNNVWYLPQAAQNVTWARRDPTAGEGQLTLENMRRAYQQMTEQREQEARLAQHAEDLYRHQMFANGINITEEVAEISNEALENLGVPKEWIKRKIDAKFKHKTFNEMLNERKK